MSDSLPSLVLWPLTAILGLCLGSFINVVALRLPIMLERSWRAEAREILALAPEPVPPRFDIAFPASRCPSCETPLRWHDNLPLVGWIKRGGRCAHCRASISRQYPLMELAGALLALAVLARQGIGLETLFLLAACLTLLALSAIDLRTRLLPDVLTLPLLWAGLLYQLAFQPLELPSAVIGTMLGYLLPWSVAMLFRWRTGTVGMGHGDFKLMAALGAWLGWPMLPLLLLLAACGGTLFGLLQRWRHPASTDGGIPFGPWIALAGWPLLLWGEPIMALYLDLVT